MEIKYDIYTLSNVGGEGSERRYVRLRQLEPKSEDSLAESIEHDSSLTKSDVRAMFAALHDYALRELSCGHRVYVPGLGYLSLSVELAHDEARRGNKISGQDIRLRGVNFRPERQLVQQIAQQVSFTRSRYSTQSAKYGEDELWQRLSALLDSQRFVTSRTVQQQFGLTKYAAHRWLALFVEKGLIVKGGAAHSPIYYKA